MESLTGRVNPQNSKYQIPIFMVLTGAGLMANYFKSPLFFDLHFLFGSIFSMLVLQMLGFASGIVSGAIISGITYHLWNHPYAIIIMTFEMAFVGLIMRRRNRGLVLADAIYWLFIGMPLVLFFYHSVMDLSISSSVITTLKQSLNGITNALIARLLFMMISLLTRKIRFSLKEILFNLLAIFMIVPSMLLTIIQGRLEFKKTDREIRDSLERVLKRESDTLNVWIETNFKSLNYITDRALDISIADIQFSINQIHAINQDTMRIGVIDKKGIVVAHSPRRDELGGLNIGKDFSDLPHMQALKKTLKPMLGEVVMARTGKSKPIVTMLSPILSKGEFSGYVAGMFDLEKVNDILFINISKETLPGLQFALVDKNNRIIATNHEKLRPMDIFIRPEGDLISVRENIYQWFPFSIKNVSVSERWKNSFYIAEKEIGSIAEWKLIFEQPIAPFQEKLYEKYTMQLGIILVLLMTALILAEITSRGVIISITKLKEITSGLPEKISTKNEIVWPMSYTEETESLLSNFKEMTQTLGQNFDEIRDVNTSLKTLTRELQESEEKYRIIFNNRIYSICIFDLDTLKLLDFNEAYVSLYGYTKEELLSGMTILDMTTHERTNNIADQYRKADGTVFLPLRYHHKKDGTVFPVEIVGGPYIWKGQWIGFCVVHDISDRVRVEEVVRESLKEKDILLREIHHRVKNNMQIISSLLDIQAMETDDESLRNLLQESQRRIKSMALVHEKLYQTHNLSKIDFGEYISIILSELMTLYRLDEKNITTKIDARHIELDIEQAVPCALIINELITNSCKYAFPEDRIGKIEISFVEKNDMFELTVRDNGIGLQPDVNHEKANPLGLQLVDLLAKQLMGSFQINSDHGTTSVVKFKRSGNGDGKNKNIDR
jgi:PAS domain S-box-containing protein